MSRERGAGGTPAPNAGAAVNAALYVRVSTKEQITENQELE
jgi:hypothetical protein